MSSELDTARRGLPRRGRWIAVAAGALVALAVVVVRENLTPSAPSVMRLPEVDYAVNDPQFRREINALFGHSLIGGNRVDTLVNGDEIFPAMLEAVRAAEESINFETFLYSDGEIARELALALASRASAGVEVNVILDWIGAGDIAPDLVEQMRDAGVRVELYRPLSWYEIDRFNHRTHRKILVVDGRIGFTGGVGIGSLWEGDGSRPGSYRDTHYRIAGVAVAQLQAAFNENWQKVRGEILTGERYFPPLDHAGTAAVQFVASAPGTGGESARKLYLHALSAARDRILIGTPYFVPDDLVLEALLAARGRGVTVEVIVPGPLTDSYAARCASTSKWGPLLEAGIEIYEYQPTFYHAKLMVVDDLWVLAGSTNFDARSFRLNDEINLNVLDREFALEQRRMFERDRALSVRVTHERWAKRPLTQRFIEPVAMLVQGQL